MIEKIILNNVASYKTQVCLETSKNINLIYGLNGTGKSTLSNFLANHQDGAFKNCSMNGFDNSQEILVYNQKFIQDYFIESKTQKGIFSLSKENKVAIEKIEQLEKDIMSLDIKKEENTSKINEKQNQLMQEKVKMQDIVWKIKQDYSGGDRVLEFCLHGLKNSKENLLNHIQELENPQEKPVKNIEELKTIVLSISGETAESCPTLPSITASFQCIENESLLQKTIVGSENSTISTVIAQLNNSDWVRAGQKYLKSPHKDEKTICPFCQHQTISEALLQEMQNYFDDSYCTDLNTLDTVLTQYVELIESIPTKDNFATNPKFREYEKNFSITYDNFIALLQNNKKLIEDKIKTPSISIKLTNSSESLQELQNAINSINDQIIAYNDNIKQKDSIRSDIFTRFWQIMRWEYDVALNLYNTQRRQSERQIELLEKEQQRLINTIEEKRKEKSLEQQKTINLEDAIKNINSNLINLGITEFQIKLHSENMYMITRGDNEDNIFYSLSEGEKTIISFLYFLELCKGKQNSGDTSRKKIIVIDDPISSLSHIYIFNIGRLIKNEFLGFHQKTKDTIKSSYNYDQVFILTHSLYFFYELTETQHDIRNAVQNLFRITKNENGSKISNLKYESIQNDYQAYWSIIKDKDQPVVLIANCMRNILEYFFSFVEKRNLNNFFQAPEFQDTRFQAFQRYINRESHSIGQNIFDFKEFNYDDFKGAFAKLFEISGYKDHYNKMMQYC